MIIGRLLRPLPLSILGSGALTGLRASGLGRAQVLTILNFHRVDDKEGSAGTGIKPRLFDELVSWLARRFAIVTFSELAFYTCKKRPPIILSFDDGYKDFIDTVVPILEKHRVRANQNLIPASLESGRPPMNVQLQDFIRSAPATLLREVKFPGLPGGADPNNRVKSGLQASRALKNRPIVDQKAIFAELQQNVERFDGFRTTQVMSIEEARQIANVHEIGAHSFEHANMASETDAYLCEDVNKCLHYFKTRLAVRPSVYAFANGSARPGQAELVRAAGVHHVLLTGEGFSRHSNWLHKRFTMFATTSAEARFRALGGFANRSSAVS